MKDRDRHWKAVLGQWYQTVRVYPPNGERMGLSKILAFLDEFRFLRSLIDNPFDLFEVFARMLDDDILMRQAAGMPTDDAFGSPNTIDLKISFFLFSEDGTRLGESAPSARFTRRGRRMFFSNYKTQPPLAQVIEELGVKDKVFYVVELFEEEHKSRRIEVFKIPRGTTLSQMLTRSTNEEKRTE